ncbi:hypothetical protein [Natrinema salinisoli]|uniref:hypothetical protein n=1 Tax=Natrinema salinisoli TaxID=2878535 RepID=UPI001CEFB228|nr:hypothetical protein [Natrinema salinisoli]
MIDDQTEYPATLDRKTVHSMGKLLLMTLSLILLLVLISLLPGIDRLVPGSPITLFAVVSAVLTMATVGLLLSLAPAVATLVQSTFEGPAQVVDDIAAIMQLLVVFIAMIIAHRGLAPAIVPLLDETAWMYDVVFLAFALPPLAILAIRVYVSLDPMAELLAERVTQSENGDDTIPEEK